MNKNIKLIGKIQTNKREGRLMIKLRIRRTTEVLCKLWEVEDNLPPLDTKLDGIIPFMLSPGKNDAGESWGISKILNSVIEPSVISLFAGYKMGTMVTKLYIANQFSTSETTLSRVAAARAVELHAPRKNIVIPEITYQWIRNTYSELLADIMMVLNH